MGAVKALHDHAKRGEVLTGVFYVETQKKNFLELLNLRDAPLWQVSEAAGRPPESALKEIMEELS